MEIDYNKLSIRDKQAVGAIALLRFCSAYNINHPGITNLVEHLLAITIADNLTEWEAKGLNLIIIGRGEAVPEAVLTTIQPELHRDFSLLVEYAVEIGIADMYGAETKQPTQFLLKVLSILKKHRIDLILPQGLFFETKSKNGWGNFWDKDRYVMLIDLT